MMPKVFLRTAYNYDMDEESLRTGLFCEDETMAVQAAAEECDINTIVRRFGLTGVMPQGVFAPSYGDFTGVSDYRSALEAVMMADESFGQMPAEVRARFQNSPQMFLDFCSNDANREEAQKLGLLFVDDKPVVSVEAKPTTIPPVEPPKAAAAQ